MPTVSPVRLPKVVKPTAAAVLIEAVQACRADEVVDWQVVARRVLGSGTQGLGAAVTRKLNADAMAAQSASKCARYLPADFLEPAHPFYNSRNLAKMLQAQVSHLSFILAIGFIAAHCPTHFLPAEADFRRP